MKLLVHQGFGIDLTINELAVTQNLYMFYMFYTTSPLVLRVSLTFSACALPMHCLFHNLTLVGLCAPTDTRHGFLACRSAYYLPH